MHRDSKLSYYKLKTQPVRNQKEVLLRVEHQYSVHPDRRIINLSGSKHEDFRNRTYQKEHSYYNLPLINLFCPSPFPYYAFICPGHVYNRKGKVHPRYQLTTRRTKEGRSPQAYHRNHSYQQRKVRLKRPVHLEPTVTPSDRN